MKIIALTFGMNAFVPTYRWIKEIQLSRKIDWDFNIESGIGRVGACDEGPSPTWQYSHKFRVLPPILRWVILLFGASFFFFYSSCTSLALASSAGNSHGLIIERYVEAAFPHPDSGLKKFNIKGSLAVEVFCWVDEISMCQSTKKFISEAIQETSALRLQETMHSPDVEFVFASKSHFDEVVEDSARKFFGGFSDAKDSDCKLFYSTEGSTIKQARIIVSLEQARKKAVTCLQQQFQQALGLSLINDFPFSVLWSFHPDGLQDRTPVELDELRRASLVLETIHSCTELTAGMTKAQVAAVLNNNPMCFTGIEEH